MRSLCCRVLLQESGYLHSVFYDDFLLVGVRLVSTHPNDDLQKAQRGKQHSEETRQKTCAVKRGISRSEETKAKMSAARMKLTGADRDQIQQLYAAGGVEQPQLAKQFGVSQTTIWRIYYSANRACPAAPELH